MMLFCHVFVHCYGAMVSILEISFLFAFWLLIFYEQCDLAAHIPSNPIIYFCTLWLFLLKYLFGYMCHDSLYRNVFKFILCCCLLHAHFYWYIYSVYIDYAEIYSNVFFVLQLIFWYSLIICFYNITYGAKDLFHQFSMSYFLLGTDIQW